MERSNITNEIDDDYEVTELDSDFPLTSQAQTNTAKRCCTLCTSVINSNEVRHGI